MINLAGIKRFFSKWQWRCLCYVVVALAGGIIWMDKLLFPAPPPTPSVGNCQIVSGDAVLDALYLKGRAGMPTVLFSHGNYQTLYDVMPLCEEFRDHGYGVIAYDYAGYGGSTGRPSAAQACRDVEAVYDYLTREKKVAPEGVVIVGYSVGGGPSCHLVGKHAVKALVLCAPFASAVRAVLPFSLPGDKFKNDAVLSRVAVPTLIFHGKKDRVIPFRNGETLFKAAKSPKKKLVARDGAGHEDLFVRLGGAFWQELAAFLETIENP